MVETEKDGILSAEQVTALREKYRTPKTHAERREAARLRKRAQRTRDKQQKAASSTETEGEWWARNRALLPPEELEMMQTQDAICRDHILVMEYAKRNDISPDDLNYIFDKDCVSDLVAFVKENPCPHLGAIHKDDNIPPDWSTGVWRNNAKYWQDPAMLGRLYAEGPATERFVKYGLLSGLPDWHVECFLVDRAKWPWKGAAELLGYHIDHRGIARYGSETT